MAYQVGHRVIGTIDKLKGHCHAGHKVGDEFELSAHQSGGLCGLFYHDIFPYIVMLQFGGHLPTEWGPEGWEGDVLTFSCMDVANSARIQLRRVGPFRPGSYID